MPARRESERAPGAGETSDDEAARLWRTFLDRADPGSFDAFDRLYADFLPTVKRYCRFHLRDAHLAEDVANVVFIRLLEARPTLESSFVGLLLRTARNLCASELGKRRPVRRMRRRRRSHEARWARRADVKAPLRKLDSQSCGRTSEGADSQLSDSSHQGR